MQEQSRVRLAAALTAALGFVTSGTANAATSEQTRIPLTEKTSLMAVDTTDSYRVNLASKDKKVKKEGQTKGKEGSCKGKEGSCKGKEGSCKGKEGSCKGKEGSKGKDDSRKGNDEGGQLPGTGTGSDY